MRQRLTLCLLLILPGVAFSHPFYNAAGNRGFDVRGSNVQNGTDILMYKYSGTPNQNFIYEGQQFKLASDKKYCLDVSRNKSYKYNGLILWECTGGLNQKFTLSGGFIYPYDNPGQCLTYSDKGDITATECKRADNQKFTFPKICLYKDGHYHGGMTCLNDSKALVENNDTASSVSVVNTVALLYEHGNFQGRLLRVDRNLPYVGNNYNDMISSVKIPAQRLFLITSDPQTICIKNCGVSEKTSLSNIQDQYSFFYNRYQDAEAVIINGDLTEFGKEKEWSKFEEMALRLKNLPYYFGLGNHDIFNNFNDCYEQNCTIRSFLKLKDHVKSKDNVYSFDMMFTRGYVFPTARETLIGSFSYSLDFGDILIIQLNDFETKHNPLKIDQYSSLAVGTGGNGTQRFVIERYQDADYSWLDNQLQQADFKNQIVILNVHRDDQDAGKLNEVLKKHNVQLRFSGHYHWNVLKTKKGSYSSGSSARGDYLKLMIDTNKRVAEIDKHQNNAIAKGAEEIMAKVNIPIKKGLPTKANNAFHIKVKNSGAYVSFVTIRYEDKNKRVQTASSGDLLAGNVYDFTVPGGGRVQRVESHTYTGLIWEPTRRIFLVEDRASDLCIKTWGTTLHPSWEQTACY